MTDAQKLKPCPFCGGKPYLANVAMVGCAYVVCTDCRMQSEDGTMNRVTTAWNTRADLIDMDVLDKVVAAWPAVRQIILEYSISFQYAEQDGDDETVSEMNDALTGLRAMMEKLK